MKLILRGSQIDRFNFVANAIFGHFEVLLNCLCGCSHRRTTFPITLRTRLTMDGQQSAQLETYIVCVECGRQFAYDWATMRTVKRPAARAAKSQFEAGDRTRAPRFAVNSVPLIGTP